LPARFFGTDINRDFLNLVEPTDFVTVLDEPAFFRGAYRTILLQRPLGPDS
jgi:hypothetical protein